MHSSLLCQGDDMSNHAMHTSTLDEQNFGCNSLMNPGDVGRAQTWPETTLAM